MIRFDPTDPFPLVAPESHSYAEAQEHSALVDAWLGFTVDAIESDLVRPEGDRNYWIGLAPRALQTPYTELRYLLELLKLEPGETIVDLGAGYGRMAFVVGRHAPEVRFIGYEVVPERVREAKRCLARLEDSNTEIVEADLASTEFRPHEADVYFLYDYGSRSAIEKTLADLREIAAKRSITVVGRGRASRDAIERGEPWLSQVVAPEHHPHFSIYRSAFAVAASPID